MDKTEKYIQKQKANFAAKINETQSFKDAYVIAAKKGDLDILGEVIGELNKRSDFLDEMWLASVEEPKKMFEFASKVGIQELYKRYTPELGQKIESLKAQDKLKFLDIMMLVNMNSGVNIEGKTAEEVNLLKQNQAKQISYLLDVFTDPEIEVGIHRTGGAVSGKEIKEQGLFLTGDLSSGCVNSIENEDIKTSLERNVSFYPNAPGLAISQICVGGHYKNYCQLEQTDIMLIAVPKEDIENGSLTEGFVKYDHNQPTLDPKYVLGYVTVNNNDNTINQIEADYTPQPSVDVNYALEQLKSGTLEVTKDPEYNSLKNRFFRFLNKLRGKDTQEKEIIHEDDKTI